MKRPNKKLEKAFIKFIKDNKLEKKYNIGAAFTWDWDADKTDFSKLDFEYISRDNFYIDSIDLYEAFMAGVESGRD